MRVVKKGSVFRVQGSVHGINAFPDILNPEP
jgi:hypothetical protein